MNNTKPTIEEIKTTIKNLSKEESLANFEIQKIQYQEEYTDFLTHYEKDECYICSKPLATISKHTPCLHWLLRRCKFKKNDFPKLYEKFDFYSISAYLYWVAYAESGSKNINNLKGERSKRKLFETTIKWKNIEWTLDCAQNDFAGHVGTKTEFPHWHFQMRIDGRQFINFNDFHIPFTETDQLKINLENDPNSGFMHSFGPGGQGMQERMEQLENNFEEFLDNSFSASNPDEGQIHMQSIITAPDGGIPGDKIDEALEMARKTGKTLAHCFNVVLKNDTGVSIATIASPADSVPEIAKRSERKRR
ncbi:hypothetical protein [Providencia stuartii]|uniref:hypothetical protein n=1 Tax=Providencia stuartii TaxID=588 RepID=UPI00197ECB30|nr:hypothetical protein [Providencia stuartii]MBN4863809.1 hypothetical protein [Providencia stuartii]MBN4873131.1 hypothetical protein [Providencia stuartii]MBN4877748.1 hypothetical protein [Providencia stuartii]MBN4882332.1 hypothetical protein [Providencia stuartii]